jgi:hypothetical protein
MPNYNSETCELFFRIVGKSQTIVSRALEELPKVFDSVIITGIKPNEKEEGFRGYAFAKLRRKPNE